MSMDYPNGDWMVALAPCEPMEPGIGARTGAAAAAINGLRINRSFCSWCPEPGLYRLSGGCGPGVDGPLVNYSVAGMILPSMTAQCGWSKWCGRVSQETGTSGKRCCRPRSRRTANAGSRPARPATTGRSPGRARAEIKLEQSSVITRPTSAAGDPGSRAPGSRRLRTAATELKTNSDQASLETGREAGLQLRLLGAPGDERIRCWNRQGAETNSALLRSGKRV